MDAGAYYQPSFLLKMPPSKDAQFNYCYSFSLFPFFLLDFELPHCCPLSAPFYRTTILWLINPAQIRIEQDSPVYRKCDDGLCFLCRHALYRHC